MRYLICGARNWTDKKKIEAVIQDMDPKTDVIIEGCALGADTIAGELAMKYGIPLIEMRANWNKFGRAAGPIRNGWMLKFGLPNKVIGFNKNIVKSKGTANMLKQARKAGIATRLIK